VTMSSAVRPSVSTRWPTRLVPRRRRHAPPDRRYAAVVWSGWPSSGPPGWAPTAAALAAKHDSCAHLLGSGMESAYGDHGWGQGTDVRPDRSFVLDRPVDHQRLGSGFPKDAPHRRQGAGRVQVRGLPQRFRQVPGQGLPAGVPPRQGCPVRPQPAHRQGCHPRQLVDGHIIASVDDPGHHDKPSPSWPSRGQWCTGSAAQRGSGPRWRSRAGSAVASAACAAEGRRQGASTSRRM
jgi:hypothetical protein